MGERGIIGRFALLPSFTRACSFPPTARFKFDQTGKTRFREIRSRNQKTRERAVPSETGVGVSSRCKIHVARRDADTRSPRSLTQPNVVGRTFKAVSYNRAFNLGASFPPRRMT